MALRRAIVIVILLRAIVVLVCCRLARDIRLAFHAVRLDLRQEIDAAKHAWRGSMGLGR